jgi:uncharacterized membrane protein
MSHKHHRSHSVHSRENKRAQFTGPAQKKRRLASAFAIAVVALAGGVAYLVVNGMNDRPSSSTVAVASRDRRQSTDQGAGGDVTIPISDLSSGRAKFFDYKASDNTSVRFFVIKSSDGVYRAALDACDVCYAARKGYYQDGDNMVCRKCGRQFPSALVNEVTGGCNPVSVPRTIDGDKLIIKASELEGRKSYF